MDVIVVASRKGGSGKTTLAGHLAVQAERSGRGPVAIIDIDPQGSLADWWNERELATPLFVQTNVRSLANNIEEIRRHNVNLVVIDTPPAITTTIGDVIRHSDLVIIPTRPSPHDLRSVGSTVTLATEMGKPLVFVVNGATPRARITNEAVAILSQHGTLAPSIVHQRVDFAASMIDGRTVMEIASPTRSVAEIEELWTYIDNRLRGGVARRLPLLPDQPERHAHRASTDLNQREAL